MSSSFFVWYVEIEEGEKDWGFSAETVIGIYMMKQNIFNYRNLVAEAYKILSVQGK